MPATIATGLILGTVLGYVMQRGRFCVTGMIRDIFLLKSWRGITALWIVIAVHAIGLAALTSAGIISPEYSALAPLAVIIGGLVFGVGIVLAGGCASGTWYRSGEGLVGSWIALIMYGLSAAAMKSGPLEGLNNALSDHTINATTIHGTLGISVWWLVIPFAALTAFLAIRFLRQEATAPRLAALTARKTGLAHILAEKPWHFYSTAVIIGLLGVLAWPLSAATGRNGGLGITTPSSDLMRFITTGDSSRLNWGLMLVIGILVGSFVAAKASGEFRVRVPSGQQAVRSIVGGTLMGVGAAWAGGCTVGNGMVETSLFTYQGWIALLFIALGVYVGAKLFLKAERGDGAVRSGAPSASPAVAATSANGASVATAVTAAGATASNTNDHNTTSNGTAQTTVDLDGLTLGSGNLIGGGVATATRPAATETHVGAGASGKNLPGLVSLGNGEYKMDTLGAVCPFPLIDAKEAIEHLDSGETLVIDFDCTQATDTIPRWAASQGHQITRFEATGDAGWVISVKKA